jgi:hypothetical protein
MLASLLVAGWLAAGLSAQTTGPGTEEVLPAPAPVIKPPVAELPRATPAALPPAATLGQVVPAQQQPPPLLPPQGPRPRALGDAGTAFRIPLELPGPERLFRLESESSFFERMRQEARDNTPPERLTFPEEPVLSRNPYYGRAWPLSKMFVEPAYVCHRRLFFEQRNLERYGWDLGIFAPFISGATFFADVAFLPYKIATQPCRHFECSAGKCLPGDPVPFLIRPPELSLTGALAEGAAIGALIVLFP